MAGVARGKMKGLSLSILPAYAFHGAFAVLALWLAMKALGA
jgi:hypothetical protein